MQSTENLKVLLKYNHLLLKRTGTNKNLSYLYLVFSVIFLSGFTIIPLFTELITFSSIQEKQEFYFVSLLIVAILDSIFTLYRISKNTVIEDIHIILFPISFLSKIVNEIKILSFDLRFVIYIPVTLIFTLKIMLQEFSIINFTISLGVSIAFYFCVTLVLLIVFGILKILFNNNRSSIINTVLIFPILFSLLNISGQKEFLFKIPILSNMSNIYNTFVQNSTEIIWIDIFIILLTISLLLVIFFTLRYKQKIRWY